MNGSGTGRLSANGVCTKGHFLVLSGPVVANSVLGYPTP